MSQAFYSDSVEAALAAAKQSLGEETLLLEAGASPPGERARGAYRVLAGVAESEPAPPAPSKKESAPPGQAGEVAGLRSELRFLRSAVESATSLAAKSYLDRSVLVRCPELAPVLHDLLHRGMPADMVRAIGDSAGRRLAPDQNGQPRPSARLALRAVAAELETRIEARPGFGRESGRRRVVALIGPSGAGKTTTLAKLAMKYGVAGRSPAAILSLDVFRIGAAEQLRSLASILGLPFQVCETPAALRRALDDWRLKEMVFIDSPGAGPEELEWWQGFAPQLAAEREVETQLVLPATASYGQLNSWIEMSAPLEPARLILTHLDEAVTPGGFLAAAMTACLPVSYLATGQSIPEELEPATKARLLELALGRGGAAHAAA